MLNTSNYFSSQIKIQARDHLYTPISIELEVLTLSLPFCLFIALTNVYTFPVTNRTHLLNIFSSCLTPFSVFIALIFIMMHTLSTLLHFTLLSCDSFIFFIFHSSGEFDGIVEKLEKPSTLKNPVLLCFNCFLVFCSKIVALK